jgi:uroporphyrin-III C-methyltransferase / precorrin-2 dehydrogenase / sirohydrochlorin ferrochelatase
MLGKVTLIGGGPGDPDLITVKGLKALQSADVIIHDLLVAQELLQEAKAGAEILDASKRSFTDEKMTQDEINAALVDRAKKGLHAVRLKGGDPYVYGRGAEEAVYCQQHGVPVEVIPGVSSLVAATAAAGFPLTHYGTSSRFLTMMGYENPDKPAFALDYDGLVKLDATLVMFMARFDRMADILNKMLAAGYDPDKPAALIYKGATPEQEVLIATISTLAGQIYERWGENPLPSLVVIGDVIKLRDQLPHIS